MLLINPEDFNIQNLNHFSFFRKKFNGTLKEKMICIKIMLLNNCNEKYIKKYINCLLNGEYNIKELSHEFGLIGETYLDKIYTNKIFILYFFSKNTLNETNFIKNMEKILPNKFNDNQNRIYILKMLNNVHLGDDIPFFYKNVTPIVLKEFFKGKFLHDNKNFFLKYNNPYIMLSKNIKISKNFSFLTEQNLKITYNKNIINFGEILLKYNTNIKIFKYLNKFKCEYKNVIKKYYDYWLFNCENKLVFDYLVDNFNHIYTDTKFKYDRVFFYNLAKRGKLSLFKELEYLIPDDLDFVVLKKYSKLNCYDNNNLIIHIKNITKNNIIKKL